MAVPFYQQNSSMPQPSQNYQPVYQVPQGYQNTYEQTSVQQNPRPQLPYANNSQPNQTHSLLLSGRTVNTVDEIKPNEVPMDGSISLFPLSDYSCIYAKQWGTDGLINTVKYIPDLNQAPKDSPAEDFNALILERLDSIEKKLNYKPYHKPYNKNRNNQPEKKEDNR